MPLSWGASDRMARSFARFAIQPGATRRMPYLCQPVFAEVSALAASSSTAGLAACLGSSGNASDQLATDTELTNTRTGCRPVGPELTDKRVPKSPTKPTDAGDASLSC
jgi:hypothetical protein